MFEATGHFILRDQVPCVILTRSPQALLNILLPTAREGADVPDEVQAQSSRLSAEGDFDVDTLEGIKSVHGVLVPMSELGPNGQKTALEIIALTKTRTLQSSQHSINFDPLGSVSGWKLTPKACVN